MTTKPAGITAPFRTAIQVGVVVRDLDESMAALTAVFGIGKTQEGAGIREGSYWVNDDTEKLIGFIIEILQPAVGSDGRTPGVVRQGEP